MGLMAHGYQPGKRRGTISLGTMDGVNQIIPKYYVRALRMEWQGYYAIKSERISVWISAVEEANVTRASANVMLAITGRTVQTGYHKNSWKWMSRRRCIHLPGMNLLPGFNSLLELQLWWYYLLKKPENDLSFSYMTWIPSLTRFFFNIESIRGTVRIEFLMASTIPYQCHMVIVQRPGCMNSCCKASTEPWIQRKPTSFTCPCTQHVYNFL